MPAPGAAGQWVSELWRAFMVVSFPSWGRGLSGSGGCLSSPRAIAYFFGLGLTEAPFYGIGKIFQHFDVATLGGAPIKPALIALGTGFLIVPASALLVRVMRELRLRAVGFSL